MAEDRKALLGVFKTTQNIIGIYLMSISDIGEMSTLSLKDIKKQQPPQPQPVPPAAIWQVIQKYLLPTDYRAAPQAEINSF